MVKWKLQIGIDSPFHELKGALLSLSTCASNCFGWVATALTVFKCKREQRKKPAGYDPNLSTNINNDLSQEFTSCRYKVLVGYTLVMEEIRKTLYVFSKVAVMHNKEQTFKLLYDMQIFFTLFVFFVILMQKREPFHRLSVVCFLYHLRLLVFLHLLLW